MKKLEQYKKLLYIEISSHFAEMVQAQGLDIGPQWFTEKRSGHLRP